MSFLLIDQNLPFAIALAILGMLVVLEILGLALGASPSSMADELMAFDIEGALPSGWLAWLGTDRGPSYLWLIVFLGCFGSAGLIVNALAEVVAGAPLGWALSVPGAFVLGLVLTSAATRGAARVLPAEESNASDVSSLEGLSAVVRQGVARKGYPAQAKLTDGHGQSHFPMVEPIDEGVELSPGEEVVLIRKAKGTWQVIKEG